MKQRERNFQMMVITSLMYVLINMIAHFTLVPLKVLFMDDIYLFNELHDINLIEYLMSGHNNKIRPVSDFFIYLGYIFFKNDTEYIYIYILIVGLISCIAIYLLTYYVVKNVYIACCVCLLFSTSRFAYYAIGQYFGVMESICMVMAAILLYSGIKYYVSKDFVDEKRCFVNMNLAVLFLVFSHERYATMYAFVFLMVLIKNKISKIAFKRYVLTILNFSLLWLFRIIYLGSDAFQGTAATSLISTLNFNNIFKFFIDGIMLILGWNAGEEYLNGIAIKQVKTIHNLIPFFIVIFMVLTFLYAVKKSNNKRKIIEINVIFIVFILFSLLAGCITIRLELRWVYVPYAMYLLLIAFNVNEIMSSQLLISKSIIIFISLAIIAMTLFNESYYRVFWKNNYLGREYEKYNNIYDMTIGKYGSEYLIGKTIYIIENKEFCEIVDRATLEEIFDYYCGKETVKTVYVDSLEELNDNNAIVLYVEQYKNDILILSQSTGL